MIFSMKITVITVPVCQVRRLKHREVADSPKVTQQCPCPWLSFWTLWPSLLDLPSVSSLSSPMYVRVNVAHWCAPLPFYGQGNWSTEQTLSGERWAEVGHKPLQSSLLCAPTSTGLPSSSPPCFPSFISLPGYGGQEDPVQRKSDDKRLPRRDNPLLKHACYSNYKGDQIGFKLELIGCSLIHAIYLALTSPSGWVGWKKKLKLVFFRTGHPIRLVLDREDDMLITGGRHPLFGKYKVSIKEENTKVPHFIWMVLPFPIIFILPNSKNNHLNIYNIKMCIWILITFCEELLVNLIKLWRS